jgi:uncharacterized protein with PQ loop repeat
MDITRLISWIGFATGLCISIPQIIKTLRTKNVEGVSALTFVLIEVTALCFLIRSFMIHESALIAYYIMIALASGIQLFLIIKYR